MKIAVAVLSLTMSLSVLLSGCASTPDYAAAYMLASKQTIEAVEFTELIMTDRAGFEREIKILSVQGRTVTISPFPYWLFAPEEIPLNHIQSLRIKRRSYPGLTAILVMAEAGFIISGGVMGLLADDREQYARAIGFGIVGAGAGAGSVLFGELRKMGKEMYPEYNLAEMSEPDKLMTILKLMGVL